LSRLIKKPKSSGCTLCNDSLREKSALIVLDSVANNPVEFTQKEFVNVAEFKRYLREHDGGFQRRIVYLMEGLSLRYASVIGRHFSIVPTISHRHKGGCICSNDSIHSDIEIPRVPQSAVEGTLCLQYGELR
jgi:hypothetical protein